MGIQHLNDCKNGEKNEVRRLQNSKCKKGPQLAHIIRKAGNQIPHAKTQQNLLWYAKYPGKKVALCGRFKSSSEVMTF